MCGEPVFKSVGLGVFLASRNHFAHEIEPPAVCKPICGSRAEFVYFPFFSRIDSELTEQLLEYLRVNGMALGRKVLTVDAAAFLGIASVEGAIYALCHVAVVLNRLIADPQFLQGHPPSSFAKRDL
jgi:hypothetical protein